MDDPARRSKEALFKARDALRRSLNAVNAALVDEVDTDRRDALELVRDLVSESELIALRLLGVRP